ncbi:non-ribosomal peptide synthetase [Pedobacter roseus]|uniref:AMP-binding protein n=1 Tax=Pedobacter roseus TaxID=336820 RepID=A0A7G9QKR3_9SPHI|nr:AMP-binding protein [Pedobacter roseus]
MDIKNLVQKIKGNGIDLSVDGDELLVSFDQFKIPSHLLATIRHYKKELVEYLTSILEYESIPRLPDQDSYQLSFAQNRLWIMSQFSEAGSAYNVSGAYIFTGKVDSTALSHSFWSLIGRHEILRTVFREEHFGNTCQVVLNLFDIAFSLGISDCRIDREIDGRISNDFGSPFDLSVGPLLRAHLYRTGDEEWVFTYVMHHIISDGWSMGILFRELLELYNGEIKGIPIELPTLGIQYRDYAAWEQSNLSRDVYAGHRDYWLGQLSGELPVLDLWSHRPRPAVKTYNGGVVHGMVEKDVSDGLRNLCQQSGSTLFMGLLSVVNILLYRYSGQDDLIVGTPMAGREHPDLEGQIGFYVNTVALRTRLNGSESFRDILGHVRGVCLDAYEHQAYPFDKLVEELGIKHNMGRNPLFDVQVILDVDVKSFSVHGFEDFLVANYHLSKETSIFDLVFSFSVIENAIKLTLRYNSDLYDFASIERMSSHFFVLLDQLVTCPDAAVGSANYVSDVEHSIILEKFNAISTAYPSEETVMSLFEKQVLLRGESPAVVFGGDQLSYAELNAYSNRLAHYLRNEHAICGGELVGILLDRSDWMIVSILGVLKSGGAYVPIDPEYPSERIAYMLSDSGCRLLLTQTAHMFVLEGYQGELFAVDLQLSCLSTPSLNPFVTCAPTDLAYVIYTSGSTGAPKGVMIEHRGVANTILGQQAFFGIKPGEAGLQFASASFDASVSEIFIILCSGATLYIVEDSVKQNPVLFCEYLSSNSIDILTLPPSYLHLLDFDKIGTVRKLITAGEPAIISDASRFFQQGKYYNAYGPTECSICVTMFELNNNSGFEKFVPIGRPISNSRVYIIDGFGGLSGIGVPGEICVGGAGVARVTLTFLN